MPHPASQIKPLSLYFWVIPLALFAAMAYFTPDWDLAISGYFYNKELEIFPGNQFFEEVRFWAIIPGMFTAVAATLFLGYTYIVPRLKQWRPYALLLILPMALGAGVITHELLKDHWGRPRPRQIENFGGDHPFRPFYKPHLTWEVQPFKSFPCGHCSVGFYFFALALVGRRMDSQWLFLLGLSLAAILGISLSLARIAQGGHFFSDTLATAFLMWTVAIACDRLIFNEQADQRKTYLKTVQ